MYVVGCCEAWHDYRIVITIEMPTVLKQEWQFLSGSRHKLENLRITTTLVNHKEIIHHCDTHTHTHRRTTMNNAYISSPASMGMRRSLVKQLLRSDRQRRRFSTRSTGNTAQQQRPPRNEASNFSAARKLLNTKQIHSVAIEEKVM